MLLATSTPVRRSLATQRAMTAGVLSGRDTRPNARHQALVAAARERLRRQLRRLAQAGVAALVHHDHLRARGARAQRPPRARARASRGARRAGQGPCVTLTRVRRASGGLSAQGASGGHAHAAAGPAWGSGPRELSWGAGRLPSLTGDAAPSD